MAKRTVAAERELRPTTLVWFRRDLRVRDHTALRAAAAEGRPLVGLFVEDPALWSRHEDAPAKVDFWLRNVDWLERALAELNVPLLRRRCGEGGSAAEIVAAAAASVNALAVHATREYEVDEAARDAQTAGRLERDGVRLVLHDDRCIIEPGALRTKSGGWYTVFTPFKNAWMAEVAERDLRPRPAVDGQAAIAGLKGPEASRVLSGAIEAAPAEAWPAGEAEAKRRLAAFVRARIDGYDEGRDRVDLAGTSELSPYLAAGVISGRECLAAAVRAGGGDVRRARAGAAAWINELVWRDFYVHVLAAYPRVSRGRAFRPSADRIAWRSSAEDLAAWEQGRTGYPIVDAAMRCLRATGWMHNRLRMVTAMFLTKHLLLDWRLGERHFMRHLVDGDLAANNGGWQWSAGTGTDAAPYFRIFNPVTQSRKIDPGGAFIRRWVPELAGVEGEEIHAPWRMGALARAGVNYPEPIVEHEAARRRALAAFGAARA